MSQVGGDIGPRNVIGPANQISKETATYDGVVTGRECRIEGGCDIEQFARLGDQVEIEGEGVVISVPGPRGRRLQAR